MMLEPQALKRHLRQRAAQLLIDESAAAARAGTAIYALTDPRDVRTPRYIGQTRSPQRRLLQHIAQARLWLPDERPWWIKEPRLRPLYEWLRELHQDDGRLPAMVVSEWVPEGTNARAIERARILDGLARNWPLLNYEQEVLGRQFALL
ncbi:MAG: hypothetical protein ABI624_15725 [Casimicrobiaceae bacterium]